MTGKPRYGHQDGAVTGYNPHQPGRPSHTYHTYFIANVRLVLEVEVQAGNQTASKYSSPGLWERLGRLPRSHWPALLRGDRDWGTQANLARAEQEGVPYLFKRRRTPGVKKTVERLMRGAEWTAAGQGWEGPETRRRLAGWTRARRAVVARRRVTADLAVVDPRDPAQMYLSFATLTEDTLVYEYAVLVTSRTHEIRRIAQRYRDRADAENPFDELKNHWGWGGFTTQDLKRCRFMARLTALTYTWWSRFVRLADPRQHTEAITSRPLCLHAPARLTRCRSDPDHHQPSACPGGVGRTRVPRDCNLLQNAAPNCGAVDAPATRVPRAVASPGEGPQRPPIASAARLTSSRITAISPQRVPVHRAETACVGQQLLFLG